MKKKILRRRPPKRLLVGTPIILLSLGGAFLLAVIVIFSFPDSDDPSPPHTTSPPPATKSPPTFAENAAALNARQKESPNAFAPLHRAWKALLPEATDADRSMIEERLEILEGEANKAYREIYRPVQAETRELVAQGKAARALEILRDWKIPADMDVDGRLTRDLQADRLGISTIADLQRDTDDLRHRYLDGDTRESPDGALREYLDSESVYVVVMAEKAARELHRLRWMDHRRREFAKRSRQPPAQWVFGDYPGRRIPTESRFSGKIPDTVRSGVDTVRRYGEEMRGEPTLELFASSARTGRELLDKAVATARWLPTTYYYRAEWSYGTMGDHLSALADLDQAIRRQGNFVEARLARTLVLIQLGQFRRSAEELRVLSDALPEPLRTPLAAAYAYAEARDKAYARADVVKAMKSLPNNLALLRMKAPEVAPNPIPDWKDAVVHETDHYVLKTTAPTTSEALEKWGRLLEAAHEFYPRIVPGVPDAPQKPVVYIFADRKEYYRHSDRQAEDQLQHSAGRYFRSERALLLYDTGKPNTGETLLHEAFHEYLDRLPVPIPTWLDEGLSDYASALAVDETGSMRLGGILKAEVRGLQTALREGWEGFRPAELFAESSGNFYGVMRSLKYDQAWSMIHYFLHGPNEYYRTLFRNYLAELAKGTRSSKAFPGTLGRIDSADLQRQWRRYVQRLK